MASKPFSPEEFKAIYSRVPRFCVDLIIRNSNGVLLALRGEGKGWDNMWHFPGGMVYYGEKVEDAVHRVAEEEASVKVNIIKNLGVMEFLDEVKERGFGHSISNAFLCDLVEGEPRPDEYSKELEFFKEIPESIVWQHRDLLKQHWNEIRQNTF